MEHHVAAVRPVKHVVYPEVRCTSRSGCEHLDYDENGEVVCLYGITDPHILNARVHCPVLEGKA